MNLCRALRSCYLSEVLADGGGVGGYLFWGFGVTASCFGGGRARGCGPRAVGRRLTCCIETGGWGFKGPFRGFRFGFFCNGGGERAEENLIGRTVLAERRTASKVPEGLTIGDFWWFAIALRKLVRSDKILKWKVPYSGQWFWLSSLYWGQISVQSDLSLWTLRLIMSRGLRFHFTQAKGESCGTDWLDPIANG